MKKLAWIGMLVAGLGSPVLAWPQQQPQPPSFKASGIQANTAPSGYSTGASEEEAQQVQGFVSQLQEMSMAAGLVSGAVISCSRQAELLHQVLTHPESFDAHHELGMFYLQHGNALLAVKYLRAGAKIKPDDTENLKALAVASFESHDYEEAADLTAELAQRLPLDAAVHRLRGASYASAGNKTKAAEEYRRSIELDNGLKSVYAAGLGLLAAGLLHEGEAALVSGTSSYPTSAELWFGRGLAELLNGRRTEALDSLLKADMIGSSELAAYTLLAHLAGTEPAANVRILSVLERMVKERPGEALMHYDYALALFKAAQAGAGDMPVAQMESELKEAIREEPHLAAAHYQLGLTYLEQGQESPGISEMSVAVRIEPDVAEWHYRLARAYRKTSQVAAADQQMQQFQGLSAKRDRGQDVSARLFDDLPPVSLSHTAAACDAGATGSIANR